jgi:hypothetical protein
MDAFQITMSIINVIAIIVMPIVAVWVGQRLQRRSELRKDKMWIFRTLLIARNGWTVDSVNALNIIDVVFVDDENVRKRWKEYYDKLCVENPNETELNKIRIAQYQLIEAIAKSLGYKNKITWETIQNPYMPTGMAESLRRQQEVLDGQLAWASIARDYKEQIKPEAMKTISNLVARNEEPTDGSHQ